MGTAKYIILDRETAGTILDNDGRTFLFDSEKEAVIYMHNDDDILADYYDGRYEVQEIIL